jgi:hypothetical protein
MSTSSREFAGISPARVEAMALRYSRATLEEVFLDVARGRGEAAREAAR